MDERGGQVAAAPRVAYVQGSATPRCGRCGDVTLTEVDALR